MHLPPLYLGNCSSHVCDGGNVGRQLCLMLLCIAGKSGGLQEHWHPAACIAAVSYWVLAMFCATSVFWDGSSI